MREATLTRECIAQAGEQRSSSSASKTTIGLNIDDTYMRIAGEGYLLLGLLLNDVLLLHLHRRSLPNGCAYTHQAAVFEA